VEGSQRFQAWSFNGKAISIQTYRLAGMPFKLAYKDHPAIPGALGQTHAGVWYQQELKQGLSEKIPSGTSWGFVASALQEQHCLKLIKQGSFKIIIHGQRPHTYYWLEHMGAH
jgi:hypothetical protein